MAWNRTPREPLEVDGFGRNWITLVELN